MNNTIDIFTKRKSILAFFDIVFIVSPGFLSIFLFRLDLFLNLDWVKLSIFSCSLLIPFIFLNLLLILAFHSPNTFEKKGSEEEKDNHMFILLSMSTVLTSVFAFIALLISFFTVSTLKLEIYSLICLEAVFLILAMFNGVNKLEHKRA